MRSLFASILIVALTALAARADFHVYMSPNAPAGGPSAADAPFDENVLPGSTGQLYLYGDGTSQLSGISLDVREMGGAIRFTSAVVNNPGGRWSFLDGPLVIADSVIQSIGAAAIPPGNPGIGGPVPDEVPGAGYLIATLGFQAIGSPGTASNLSIGVGNNLIADYEGRVALVRFGSPQAFPNEASSPGHFGFTGRITVVPEPSGILLIAAALGLIAVMGRRFT